MVYAALAAVRPTDEAELLELARSSADAAGLRAQPWEWLRPQRDGSGADDQPSVEVSCFTAFGIRVDGTDWLPDGVRPRARSLLRLMTLHAGRPMHRERLAASLWGELENDAAMHNLQVAISTLRKTLQQHATPIEIKRDGDAYRLELGPGAQSDVDEFERSLARATHARAAGDVATAAAGFGRALECYTGDLLSEEGAEWVLEPRERFRTLAAGAASALAELELARDDAAAAAAAAARGVHIDRCHDGSWRALIRAHELSGDLASAEQAQRGYRSMLDSLGVSDE